MSDTKRVPGITYSHRVTKGTIWLNRKMPGWFMLVEPDDFSNVSGWSDALGFIARSRGYTRYPGFALARLAYDYDDVNGMSDFALSHEEAIAYGFETDLGLDVSERKRAEKILDTAWRTRIRRFRESQAEQFEIIDLSNGIKFVQEKYQRI